MSPEDRARYSANAMWENDTASAWLGMERGPVGPGWAEMSMTVGPNHLQGHRICHGGFIFTLADSAFAFACNSYNQRTVAHQNAITFIAPALLGDVLVARAEEVVQAGRSGVYDITVTKQDGTLVAVMRGNSRTVKGSHFEEEETP